MIIHSYVISMGGDWDVLPDALSSLAGFSDHIYVVDGGMGTRILDHNPRNSLCLSESVFGKKLGDTDFGGRTLITSWRDTPLTLWENEFLDYGHQRTWTLGRMLSEPIQPDWIVWIDSDEVCTREFYGDARGFLESMPDSVTNVCPKWLTLIQDEKHYFPDHSSWLAHARIHRPGAIKWHGSVHEHMTYSGNRVQWNRYILHRRMLERKRLWVQRSHPTLRDGWSNVECVPLPDGLATWDTLHYNQDELLPFDQDASLIWDKSGNRIEGTRP